jgi:hypothetical protein
MAVIQFGAIVTNAKGKIGGHYLSNSLGGACIISNPKVNKGAYAKGSAAASTSTYNRSQVSSTLLLVVRSWKNVSAANKLAWQAAAPNFPTVNKLGQPVKPSAYHCYVHVNYGYYLNHGTLLGSPPAVQVGVLPPVFTIVTCSSSVQEININPAIPTGYLGYLKATRSLSPGVKPTSSDFTTIDYFGAAISGNQVVTTQYNARFGAPISGNMVWFQMHLSSLVTGLLGTPYIIGQIVT